MTTGTEPEKLTADQRAEILARSIHRAAIEGGWRVTSQTQSNAQLVKGRRVNHILHLLLTIVTVGLWAIVWIIVAATGGEKHQFVSVDEYGNVSPTFLAPAGPRSLPSLVPEARSRRLDDVVAQLMSQGWTLDNRTETAAELTKRNWLWPWRPHHHRVSIDEHGQLRYG
jgi:hypothetical protein